MRRRIIRRWPRWRARSATRRCATGAPSAARLANNDPSACYPSAVLASGATIVTNTREIAADDFFQGMFTTALDEGEIITAVRFPIPQKAAYAKFLQPASRFALTGVFVAKYAGGVRVAVTGASEGGVFRWTEAEAALSANFSPRGVGGLDGAGRWHDRRSARHARDRIARIWSRG
jgi:aerobic carbon-monoxide dehydrogenase medium subunit